MKREPEHRCWMRFHRLSNAEAQNNSRRLCSLMVPFDRLSKVQQLGDDFA